MADVTFRTGSYADYVNAFITGGQSPVPGCLYYLYETVNGVEKTHIFLDGKEYGSSGNTQWVPISNE